jgi:hypothetical protein
MQIQESKTIPLKNNKNIIISKISQKAKTFFAAYKVKIRYQNGL